ncbi:retron system putative HNH endonuclease [Microbulbifer sp. CNSA002]|uniref:retron system putative HNH endonuclease n=1 Tax=Microbulbifer sp. CNSA002 TaxID=3373604 RepID=UPI0039B497D6
MKFIAKRRKHVDCLYAENQLPPSTNVEATRRWGRFNDKCHLTDILNEEQYYLCAYTELRPDLEGIGTHIEHVKPKSKYPSLTFDYKNLVVSALKSEDLQFHRGNVFGGHAKKSHFDKRQFKSPLRARVKRNYFLYLSDGRVVPSPSKTKRYQRKVRHTINLLNLNAPYLVNLRKRWLDDLDDLIDDHLTDGQSIYYLASVDLVPRGGKLSQFFSATRQRFGGISNRVLKTEAGDLL